MAIRSRAALISLAVALAAILALGITERPPVSAQAQQTLYSPWTLITVNQGGPVDEVLDGPFIDAVFAWNTAREAFDGWQRALPPALNSLQAIADGQAVWVLASRPDAFTQAAFAGPQQVALVDGWTMVGWTGADTDAEVVSAILGAAIVIAYDGPTQEFQRYDAGGLAFLNSLARVQQGDGLWIFREGAGSATIPGPVLLVSDPAAAAAGVSVSLPDGWTSQTTPGLYVAAEAGPDLDVAEAPTGPRLIVERVPDAPLDTAAIVDDLVAVLEDDEPVTVITEPASASVGGAPGASVTLDEGAGAAAVVTRYLFVLAPDRTVWAIRLQAPASQWPASEATLVAILASIAFQSPGVAVSQAPTSRNLTLEGIVSASATFGNRTEFLPGRAVDNDTGTSWFSAGPGPDGTSTFTWSAFEDFHITRVEVFGNGLHDNPSFRLSFGLRNVEVRLLDAAGTIVATQSGSGFGATFTFDATARTVQLIFSGHQSNDCGGFAELDIFGYEPQAVVPPPEQPGDGGGDPAGSELEDLVATLDDEDRAAYEENIQDLGLNLNADQVEQFLFTRRTFKDAFDNLFADLELGFSLDFSVAARAAGYAAIENADGSARFPLTGLLIQNNGKLLGKLGSADADALIDFLLLADLAGAP